MSDKDSDVCDSQEEWSEEESSNSSDDNFLDDLESRMESDDSYQEEEKEDEDDAEEVEEDENDEEADIAIPQRPDNLKRRISAVEGPIEQATSAKSPRVDSGTFYLSFVLHFVKF